MHFYKKARFSKTTPAVLNGDRQPHRSTVCITFVEVIAHVDRFWSRITFRIMFKEKVTLLLKGRLSTGGSHMSEIWGRKKPRQAFPPQNLRRGCFEPTAWWLSETTLTAAPGQGYATTINSKSAWCHMSIKVVDLNSTNCTHIENCMTYNLRLVGCIVALAHWH
jgi:hypothetical protein